MKKRKLILEQLDKKIIGFNDLDKIVLPPNGWIYSIRQAINMSLRQLGKRLNITPQSVKEIEEREKNGTITLNKLREASAAMDMKLVYAIIPQEESLEKIISTKRTDCEWHFIGPCQSNKTSSIAANFDWVHSVDRLKIAQRLNDQRESDRALNICLQINISNETSKAGIRPEQLPELTEAILNLPRLRLRGLMVLPAAESNIEKQRTVFAQVKSLFDECHSHDHRLDTLSMGMSNDMEAAITEGATIVRIGTDIFGARGSKFSAAK